MNEQEFATLAKASRRAAGLTLLGVVIVVGSLLYASSQLYRSNEQLQQNERLLQSNQQQLDQVRAEVQEKTTALLTLNDQIESARQQLDVIKAELASNPVNNQNTALTEKLSYLDNTISAAKTDATVALELPGLVEKMNDATKRVRMGAVAELVSTYKNEPLAVEQAVNMLEPSKLDKLSAEGRINVLYFLRHTDPTAWDAASLTRARAAVDAIHQRADGSSVAIGPQTQEELKQLSTYLGQIEGQ